MAPIKYCMAGVNGYRVFYREAGPPDAPKLLYYTASPARVTCSVT